MKRFKPVSFKAKFVDRSGSRRQDISWSLDRHTLDKSLGNSSTASPVDREIDNTNVHLPEDADASDDFQHSVSAHQNRRIQEEIKWSTLRDRLLNTEIECSILPNETICVWCHENGAVARCIYCGPQVYFCLDCAKRLHGNINTYHVLELWKDGMFVPLFPNHHVLGRSDHQCSSGEIRMIQCIDEHGNHHSKKIRFCQCEHPAVTLVRLHLWPGSPDRPTTAFQFRLMDQATDMFISCKVSLKEFTDVLEMKRPLLQPKIVNSIYSILNSGCFEEYRFFKYHLQHLVRHCLDIDNGSNCPVCPEEEGILIECMDACFGLSRKRSQGCGFATPKHQDLFFGDQNDVDNFVDHYSELSVSEQNCNHFHAGEVLPNLRSKGKNKLFDEKGVFGSVCRHDFPKSFISIKHGERISYSVYELQKLKEVSKPNVQLIVMYDIACILSKHIQNNASLSALANVSLAIPIFHCYGHKATCQVKFSPRRTKGVGLTDGEGTERLWSFLRDFSAITKEMSPEKRIDTLTDGLLHYGKGIVKKLGPVLKAKLLRAKELLSNTYKQLDELFKSLPVPYHHDIIREWMNLEETSIDPVESVVTQEWDELYVELLLTTKTIRNHLAYAEATDDDKLLEIQRKLDRNVKRLETLEKKNDVRQRWQEHEPLFLSAKRRLDEKNTRRQMLQLHKLASERIFLLEMKRKYADGQAIAVKLSKQITKATESMKKAIASHNAIQGASTLSFDLAKDPSCELYANLQSCPHVEHVVPNATRRMAIELHCLRERCEEEINLVASEMNRLQAFYLKQNRILEAAMSKELATESADLTLGLNSLFLSKRAENVKQLHILQSLWKDTSSFHLEQNQIPSGSFYEFLDSSMLPLVGAMEDVEESCSDSESDFDCDY